MAAAVVDLSTRPRERVRGRFLVCTDAAVLYFSKPSEGLVGFPITAAKGAAGSRTFVMDADGWLAWSAGEEVRVQYVGEARFSFEIEQVA